MDIYNSRVCENMEFLKIYGAKWEIEKKLYIDLLEIMEPVGYIGLSKTWRGITTSLGSK